MSRNEYKIGDMDSSQRQLRGPRGPGGPGLGVPGEKARNFGATMMKLAKYIGSYISLVITALLLGAAGTVFVIIGPDKLRDITNTITAGIAGTIDMDSITRISVFLFILYGLGFIFNYFQGFIMSTVTQRTAYRLRSGISRKINKLPLSYFDKNSIGDVLSRVTNDVDTLGMTMNQSVSLLVSQPLQIVGAFIMMLISNWIMALCALASTFIGFFLMSAIIKKSQKYFIRQQTDLGKINGHIEETYAGHTTVKAYNGEKKASEEFFRINDRLYDSAWKSQFMSSIMMPIMMFTGNFGYVVVCVVGSLLTMHERIDFGVVVAFMAYIRLFTHPLSQLAQVVTNLQSMAAASERVFDFLEEEELPDESEKTAAVEYPRGEVEFRNVHFGYDPEKIIISDFSAMAKPGQKIAIVGPTGAGKTTIVNLLMRFYELNGGEILVDGVSTRDMPRERVHDLFCMVLQDTWLFEGTLRENIVFSKQGVTDEQIEAACRAVGLHHFIKTLPQGYDTVLGDNASLSAGQRQLVTIARAMIEDAPLLILDEATSSVDTRTEVVIQRAMDTLTKGRTSFVIAHRLSTIRNADLILVMNGGDIIESGNHEELLEKGGFYAELYNSQFETVS